MPLFMVSFWQLKTKKQSDMNVKIADIMVKQVITVGPHKTLEQAQLIMQDKNIHSLPIVDGDGTAIGIITTSDFTKGHSPDSKLRQIMTKRVYCVPAYNDVHVAARIMRNHKIHHVIVLDEKKVAGIISSFDLLKLVEEHRFVMKNPPTPSRKASKRQ
jgi:CBS domain-containing protein